MDVEYISSSEIYIRPKLASPSRDAAKTRQSPSYSNISHLYISVITQAARLN